MLYLRAQFRYPSPRRAVPVDRRSGMIENTFDLRPRLQMEFFRPERVRDPALFVAEMPGSLRSPHTPIDLSRYQLAVTRRAYQTAGPRTFSLKSLRFSRVKLPNRACSSLLNSYLSAIIERARERGENFRCLREHLCETKVIDDEQREFTITRRLFFRKRGNKYFSSTSTSIFYKMRFHKMTIGCLRCIGKLHISQFEVMFIWSLCEFYESWRRIWTNERRVLKYAVRKDRLFRERYFLIKRVNSRAKWMNVIPFKKLIPLI